jgi:hypothetical protein
VGLVEIVDIEHKGPLRRGKAAEIHELAVAEDGIGMVRARAFFTKGLAAQLATARVHAEKFAALQTRRT